MAKTKAFPFTQNYLLDHFDFNFEKGIIRKKGTQRLFFINKNQNGYLTGLFEKKSYYAHRIIYFAYYNLQPIEIDHIDRISSNNSINNLRAITHSCNSLNKRNQGIMQTQSGKYTAKVYYNEKVIHLGTFDTLNEADFATYYFRLDHNMLLPQYLKNKSEDIIE